MIVFFKKYRFLLTFVAGIFYGCTNGKQDKTPRKPEEVPLVYKLVSDPDFHYNQDTIYYKSTKFSGIQYALYPNMDTIFVKPFLNGLAEGVQKQWYSNKILAEERLYVTNKKEGVHKGWWENGNPKFCYHFFDDEYDGEVMEWYFGGQLFKKFHYAMGYEEGSERLWYEDGSVRANYVIKKGRKYGLIGIKICRNPYEKTTNKKQ